MKPFRPRMILGCCSLVALAALLLLTVHLRAKAIGDPSSWGFALSNLDRSCTPCDNFYEFAMGGWMKANPIPPEYPTWGTFAQLRDNNLTALRTILDAAARANAVAGSQPIDKDLAGIKAISDRKTLDAEIARLQRQGANVLFRFSSGQ